MNKILFKFSTIRNPRDYGRKYNLISDSRDSDILRAIEAKKPAKDVQRHISNALRNIPEFTFSDTFKNLIILYDKIGSEVKASSQKTIHNSKVKSIFKDVFESKAPSTKKQLPELQKRYGHLLTAVKLSSNRTRNKQKEEFIRLLKAWSAISMVEAANHPDPVKWLNIYSSTFVIPLGKDNLPEFISDDESNNSVPNSDKRKKYDKLVKDYVGFKNTLDQLNTVVDDLNTLESFQNLKKEDVTDKETINKLSNTFLFKSVFNNTKFLTHRIHRINNKNVDQNKLVSRIQSILKSKNEGIINSLNKFVADHGVSENDIKSGKAIDKVLSKKVELESNMQDLEAFAKNEFGTNLDPSNIPQLPNLPKIPIPFDSPNNPTFPEIDPNSADQEEPLFKLLVSDLILVEENNVGYLASDIAHIETAMEGELRSKEHRTLDRTERRLTTSESTEVKQHLNLATNSQTDFQSEVEDAQKRKFGGEIESSYKNPSFSIDVRGYYDNEKEKLEKTINESAKEITEEARIEVTRKINQERTEISINEVEIINKHQIENNGDNGHLNGIYQWVDQIKQFHTLNYGRHLMSKFILPDPAKLLYLRSEEEESTATLDDFPLNHPAEISNTGDALRVGKKYGITEFETPPLSNKYISKTIEFNDKTSNSVSADYILHSDEIVIPVEGYEIANITVQYRCPWKNPNDFDERKMLTIGILGSLFGVINNGSSYNTYEEHGAIGSGVLVLEHNDPYTTGQIAFNYLAGDITMGLEKIPISLMTRNNNYFQAQVIVELRRNEWSEGSAYYEWQKKVYHKLYQAYLKKKEELKQNERNNREERMLSVIGGQNPLKNKQLIKEEFKRQIIRLLSEDSNHTFKGFFTPVEEVFEVQVDQMRQYAELIDFFENAIDWDKMSYKLFPYYWHDSEQWIERQKYEDPDPHFEAFMKSGAAETIVPVKRGYERKFIHYIEQGEPWNHNEPLSITSEEHADLLAEVNEFEGEEVEATQIGTPWRSRIPTNLIILSDKNQLEEIPPLNGDTENG